MDMTDLLALAKYLKLEPAAHVQTLNPAFGRKPCFHLQKIIKFADPKSWRLIDLDNGFSRDERSIFRLEKRWADADVVSFRLETLALDDLPPIAYPRDKGSYSSYLVSEPRFNKSRMKPAATDCHFIQDMRNPASRYVADCIKRLHCRCFMTPAGLQPH